MLSSRSAPLRTTLDGSSAPLGSLATLASISRPMRPPTLELSILVYRLGLLRSECCSSCLRTKAIDSPVERGRKEERIAFCRTFPRPTSERRSDLLPKRKSCRLFAAFFEVARISSPRVDILVGGLCASNNDKRKDGGDLCTSMASEFRPKLPRTPRSPLSLSRTMRRCTPTTLP